jgi:hypothetical protein
LRVSALRTCFSCTQKFIIIIIRQK